VVDLVVEPLTPDRFGDLARLFDEGGDPKTCWCMFFRLPSRDWSFSKPDEFRAGLERLTHDELAPGLVGYQDGRAVAWVSLAPRTDYARLTTARVLAPVDDKPVWSIVCFVVSRSARGRGVATAMLKAAIEFARQHGATTLEGYPLATERGRVSAANAYHGTQSMFEKAGFTVVAVRRANATTAPRPIVRLEL
jgi:GNAT superfamily N-acetyltransferase